MKTIGIIGSGKAAHTLIPKLSDRFEVALFARNQKKVKELASKYAISTHQQTHELSSCDVVILAVSDSAIGEVAEQLGSYKGLGIHLSGTQGLDEMPFERKAVMWPIQSLNGEDSHLDDTPFYYESSENDQDMIELLISQLGGKAIPSDQNLRDKMHLCAVLSNNFSNYLFTLCHDLIGSDNAQNLLPILKESVRSWETRHPEDTQTGPAVRKDVKSMEKHLALLENCPDIRQVYQLISKLIQERHELL